MPWATVPADLAALARSVFCVGYTGTTVADLPLAALHAFGPGAILVFGRNVGSDAELRASIAALRTCGDPPPLIAIDQEGGRVARIRDDRLVAQLPCALAFGAADDPAACEQAGIRVGRDLARLGISVNFAPCADLALDPRNTVIGNRSFGDLPPAVAQLVASFARGLERGGVAAAVKHFPGHGATAIDSHLALPRIDVDAATLRTRDLVPFAAVLASAAASIVMPAHIIVDALDAQLPATISARVLTDFLRTELGFRGVIATDCLQMDAIAATIGTAAGAVAALAAGADLLLVSHQLAVADSAADAIVAAIGAGKLAESRLAAAAARVRALRERYAVPAPYSGDLAPGVALDVAQRAVTQLRGDLRLQPGKAVTVISFEGNAGDGAAAARTVVPSLSAALRARRLKSEVMRVSAEPDPGDIDLLLAHLTSLGDRNFVVLTRRAHLHPAQRSAVEAIVQRVPQAIVISAREPFDAGMFATARNLGCIYGDEAISLEGCADVLCGRVAAAGRLPVRIDRAAVR